MSAREGDLQVWWIPQVPMHPFTVEVRSIREAKLLLGTLADYDTFQYENRIKPDYSNDGGLNVFEDGEWVEWCSDWGFKINEVDDEGKEIDP